MPFLPCFSFAGDCTAPNRMPEHGPVEFDPGKNKVEFHYAGLSFVSPQKVRYQFWLEGIDDTWVNAGDRRAAYYTNLEPGEYKFHVRAQNSDGVWSQMRRANPLQPENAFRERKPEVRGRNDDWACRDRSRTQYCSGATAADSLGTGML